MEDWTESVKVEEQNLQEYLCQKQHTVVLQGAVQTLKHTLVPVPTTNGGDGYVHFGDMLTLRSACTRGLLQVDAAETQVNTGSAEVVGFGLSTGSVITSCPRTNLTICRVDDNDRFGRDDRLHFDQIIRLGTLNLLHEALNLLACMNVLTTCLQALVDTPKMRSHRSVFAREQPPDRIGAFALSVPKATRGQDPPTCDLSSPNASMVTGLQMRMTESKWEMPFLWSLAMAPWASAPLVTAIVAFQPLGVSGALSLPVYQSLDWLVLAIRQHIVKSAFEGAPSSSNLESLKQYTPSVQDVSFCSSTAGPRCGLFGQTSRPLVADGAMYDDLRLTLLKVGHNQIPAM
eukprot:symbB.v1.2.037193.t1/scaffold5424.1/size27344/1